MKNNQRLDPSERAFFTRVTRAAFMNPFSDERVGLDREILGGQEKPGDARGRVGQVMRTVAQRVEELGQRKAVNLGAYSQEDQAVLRYALLFDVFHRFLDRFDRLTLDDLQAGDALVPVPFARETLGLLVQRGFATPVACGYFAMFYQLRRAYHFIDHALIGQTSVMKEFRRRLWNNVFTHDIEWYEKHLWNRMEDFSTLILGDTGSGKGAAAAAIGRSAFIPFDEHKQRFVRSISRTFVSMNLSQFPESLIESELFGHRKGAFTGAIDHHEGIFARSTPHGALFLDEIGEVPETVQIKLLNVLQDRTFSPVGSHEARRFHGRVIAATNQSPDQLRRDGRMRSDFYYRLCSDVIVAPTLWERLQEDRRERDRLVEHLLQRMTGSEAPELLERVIGALNKHPGPDYAWPGNVRELEQAIRRVLLTGRYDGDTITQNDTSETGDYGLLADMKAGRLSAQELLSRYCTLLHEQLGTYGEVARRTGLDWRTVKKYVDAEAG